MYYHRVVKIHCTYARVPVVVISVESPRFRRGPVL